MRAIWLSAVSDRDKDLSLPLDHASAGPEADTTRSFEARNIPIDGDIPKLSHVNADSTDRFPVGYFERSGAAFADALFGRQLARIELEAGPSTVFAVGGSPSLSEL
jgi:hypothetical protein